MGRCYKRYALSFHCCLHCPCIVQTKHLVRIVNENVEPAKKVGAQNSPDVHVGSQRMVELRNKNLLMGYGTRAHFNQVQLRQQSLRWEADGEHLSLALALQS